MFFSILLLSIAYPGMTSIENAGIRGLQIHSQEEGMNKLFLENHIDLLKLDNKRTNIFIAKKTKEELKEAINKDPKNYKNYYQLALVKYLKEADYMSAISDLDNVINLKKDFADAYFLRGYLYGIELLDTGNALKDLTQVIKYRSNDSDAYALRSYLTWSELGDFSQAMKDAQKSVDLDPENSIALYARGFLSLDYHYELRDDGKDDEAESMLR